ncbi:MAG: ABC transporter permease [Candidatus Acidiferrales bacterium]
MPLLSSVKSLLRNVFRRRAVEGELEAELRAHIDLLVEENVRAGMTSDEARRVARLEVGGEEMVKENVREERSGGWLHPLAADIKFGARQLAKSPAFTTVAVLTLALGIGGTAAMFSFVNAVLIRKPPFPDADRIVRLWEVPCNNCINGVSAMNFLDWKNQSSSFDFVSAKNQRNAILSDGDKPQMINVSRVSPQYFDIFGIQPILGRKFAADADQPGKQFDVMLSHRIWEDRFGSDPQIVGKSIHLNGASYTVAGVLPPGSYDRGWTDVWMPLAVAPEERTRNYHWLTVWGKLKPGVTLAQGDADLRSIAARIEHDYPQSNKGWSATVKRYEDMMVDDDLRKSLLILLSAVGAVLLIGCLNLANLLLARGAGREREIAVRSALGAGRARLVRQFLTESVLLAAIGGCFGLALAFGAIATIQRFMPRYWLPPEASVSLNWQVLLFTLAVTMATGIFFGIAPAFRSARTDVVESLKDGAKGMGHGVHHARLKNILVVSEIAVAFVLLSSAGLLMSTLNHLQAVDAGFETTNVISMNMSMSHEQYPDADHINAYQEQVLERVSAVPGVRSAALTSALPLEGWSDGMPFQVQGQPEVEVARRHSVGMKSVSPAYLSTIGMRLDRGRWIAESDTPGTAPVIVVNESFVKKFLPDVDPLGQILRIEQIIPGEPALGPEIVWQIVGVVTDEKSSALNETNAGMYVPLKQSPNLGVSLVVRGEIDTANLVKPIETAVRSVNADQALDEIKTLDQIKAESMGDNRMRAVLLGIFASLALLLAAIGVYGVISYSVSQRTHEIGVRAALGASRGAQLALVLKSGLALTAAGLAIGLVGTLAISKLLESALFGVSPHDPGTLGLVSAALALVAAAACYVPAYRATRVDPMVALRHE